MPAQAIAKSQPREIITERRRTPRRPHEVEASLSSPTGGTPLGVTSIDLSRHGVGLNVKTPVAAGTYHVLNLGLGAQRIVSEVRILSCRKLADGTFRVHAEFS